MSANSIEGEVEYFVPTAGKNCKIWYKVVGDLSSSHPPLLTLHDLSLSHSYLLPLSIFATRYKIPVVFFDQVGTGDSTHLREKEGDAAFWSEEFFMDQIDKLLEHLGIREFDLLGHIWGSMLGSRYAIQRASVPLASRHKLRRLVLSSPIADLNVWGDGRRKLRAKLLPENLLALFSKHETKGIADLKPTEAEAKALLEATSVFYQSHWRLPKPMPDEIVASLGWIESDPTIFRTMLGSSEFHVTGSLKDWSTVDELHKINVPTLLLNGRRDDIQEPAVAPFFWKIPKVKWVTLPNSSEVCHYEDPELFEKVVKDFLLG